MNKNYLIWLAIFLKIIGGPLSDVAYILLAIFALFGKKQIILALFVSWFFGMSNGYLFTDGSYSAVLRFVVILFCFISVAVRVDFSKNILHVSRIMFKTLLIGFYFLAHSLIFSQVTDVSVMKSVSWSLVMVTILSAWEGVSDEEHVELSWTIFFGLTAIEIVSIFFIASPAGYIINDSGFQGILNQPQAFGPVMALLGVLLIVKIISNANMPWWSILLLVTTMVVIFMSEARTAIFSMISGVVFSIFIIGQISGKKYSDLFPGLLNFKINILIIAVVFAGILFSGLIYEKFDEFINKRGTATSGLADAYDQSRGFLIRDMISNIEKNTFFGIGFGIGSWPDEMIVIRDPVFGVPTSAAIEKGVMPLAVFEEVGIFGFLAFLAWMKEIFRISIKSGASSLAIVSCIFILNLGESTLFSAGGLGLIMLIMIGMVVTERRLPN